MTRAGDTERGGARDRRATSARSALAARLSRPASPARGRSAAGFISLFSPFRSASHAMGSPASDGSASAHGCVSARRSAYPGSLSAWRSASLRSLPGGASRPVPPAAPGERSVRAWLGRALTAARALARHRRFQRIARRLPAPGGACSMPVRPGPVPEVPTPAPSWLIPRRRGLRTQFAARSVVAERARRGGIHIDRDRVFRPRLAGPSSPTPPKASL